VRIYYLIVGILGTAVLCWASVQYHVPLPVAVVMGFVPGTLLNCAWTWRRR
jgi:hypothetical protein